MKKYIALCLSLIVLNSCNLFSPLSNKKGFEVFFDHKTWATQKKILNQKIKEHQLPCNFFQGQTIIGLDFSGMDLSGKDFKDCKLIEVNLAGVDLTNTTFYNTNFDRCNSVGAFFRYSLDEPKDRLKKVFKISTNDNYKLIKQYSDLMNQQEEKKKQAADLGHQAKCLNHLFGVLKINLIGECLEKFHLIDINLQNANLDNAILGGARFYKGFTVPAYRCPWDLFDRFKEAVNKNTSEKQGYLKLINNGFNIFEYISHERLKEVNWVGLNLTNARLIGAKLQGLNLKGVDFTGASLIGADLTNTNLIGATFKNTNLFESNLHRAWFSENFQLKYNQSSDLFEKWFKANIDKNPEKKYYNLLVANKFNMFMGVSKECFLKVLQKKLDLKNAFLVKNQLKGVELSGIDFENTDMYNVDFSKSILKNICFQNALLSKSNFNQSILKSVSFKGARLGSADFTGATLENVDFFAANIGEMKLSDTVTLPYSNKDQDYVNFYHSCQDPKAKALLKIILESRDILL